MIEKRKLSMDSTSIYSDLSIYDIDIDFEIKNGKPVWVVILQRNARSSQPLLKDDKTD